MDETEKDGNTDKAEKNEVIEAIKLVISHHHRGERYRLHWRCPSGSLG